MKKAVFLMLYVVICFQSCAKQDKKPKVNPENDRITEFVENMVTRFDIPGVAIAITKNDSLYYEKAFGLKNIDTKEGLNATHFFHFASISKTFVATAIMQLVEKKQISLDHKLTNYLPYFKLNDPRYKDISIKHLLNHTSGIGDINDYEWDKPTNDSMAIENFVKGLANEKLLFEPGSDWSYSNIGFNVLGDVIEKVSGITFEQYMRLNIFEPLKMKNSSFAYSEIPKNSRTSPHTWGGKKTVSEIYPYNRIHTASGTLNSSVVEMSNWAICYLNKGAFQKTKLFTKESHNDLWSKSMELEDKPEIGLSWFIGKHRDKKSIWHGGRDLGFTSYLVLIPEENISVIVASNYQLSPIDWIANGALDIMLGFEPEEYKHHIGFKFVEIYNDKGIEAARNFYKAVVSDSLKLNDYIVDSGGLIPVANFAKNNTSKEAAKVLFEFNVEINPNVVDAHNSMGGLLLQMGKYDDAKTSFIKALELDPKNEFSKLKLLEIENLNKN